MPQFVGSSAEGHLNTGLAPEAPPTDEESLDFQDGIVLTQEEHERLATFLSEEVAQAEMETQDFRNRVILWREFIDPKVTEKSFPWLHASNVFVPIPRTVLDALKASVKQTITKQQKMWIAEIDNPDPAGITAEEIFTAQEALAEFAQKISVEPGFLELPRLIDEWVEELLVTGIGPVKLVVESDTRNVVGKGGNERPVTLRSGPRIFVVPVDTWVWPVGMWRSVQDMTWCGNWVKLTGATLRERQFPPWNYLNVEEVIDASQNQIIPVSDAQTQKQSTLGQTPMSGDGFQTYDVSLLWDLHKDGKFHDIMVTFNKDNRKVHRIIYNQADDALKPYEVEVGSPRSGTVFGRGIIEPITQPCKGINTAVNQTFDSQTLANAPSLLYPEDSEAAAILSDGFFPGMPIPYKESKDEIDILKFPDPSATSFQLVGFFMNVVERLTRVGPARLGEVSEGRRVPASLGLANQQIGAELIDELIDRFRETLGRLVSRSIGLFAESDPDIFERLMGEEKGKLLLKIMQASKDNRRSSLEVLKLRLSASSATRSVELERQNALAVAQFLFGWYQQAIQLVSLFLQPETPAVARQILLDVLKSAQEQMQRIVRLADQPDFKTLVPDMVGRLEALLQQTPGGGPGTPPSGPPPSGPLPPGAGDVLGGLQGGAVAAGGAIPQPQGGGQ